MHSLTPRQFDVLESLLGSLTTRGVFPTPIEIARRIGLRTASAVRGHLIALERKGYISRDPKRRRLSVLRGLGGEHVRLAIVIEEDE